MFEPHPQMTRPERNQWPRCWTALEPARVQALAHQLSQAYRVVDVLPTETGLALLPIHEGALGEVFNLGEIPLARAWVELHSLDGHKAQGAALLMDDRASLCRAVAVLDAVTAAQWPGSDQAEELLQLGLQALQREQAQRRALLAATRVNFSLMDQAGDDEHDEH